MQQLHPGMFGGETVYFSLAAKNCSHLPNLAHLSEMSVQPIVMMRSVIRMLTLIITFFLFFFYDEYLVDRYNCSDSSVNIYSPTYSLYLVSFAKQKTCKTIDAFDQSWTRLILTSTEDAPLLPPPDNFFSSITLVSQQLCWCIREVIRPVFSRVKMAQDC